MSKNNLHPSRTLEARIEACLRDFESADAKRLLLEARDWIRSQRRDAPKFSIATIRQISIANPGEWEGELVGGEGFFIRYSRGKLCAYADDQLVEFVEYGHPTAAHVEFSVVRDLLSRVFRFPPVAQNPADGQPGSPIFSRVLRENAP
ncbi:MAG: hypothetical protein IT462_14605 [Planctomycetes bacterium]|nr:hypothetical protein [Planctomycetota bacterium]